MNIEQQTENKVVLFGGAGLVGQNLVVLLKERGYSRLTVIDKHEANIAVLRGLHPDLNVIEADMAEPGDWQDSVRNATAVVMLQAQIGGEVEEEFRRNNIQATQYALQACQRHRVPYLVHISSSVVQSMARDWYTESKKAQEKIVAECGIPNCILRPTLMFGWFDRKHLGWLSRFMKRVPIFPVPGNGRYMRQPLYVRDFCNIIINCITRQPRGEIYDISGCERIDYIDIIRKIRNVNSAKTLIFKIPYSLFWLLLKTFAIFNRNPPFTTKQLAALVTPDEFVVIPWWEIFGVQATPFEKAIRETFQDPVYSKVFLEF